MQRAGSGGAAARIAAARGFGPALLGMLDYLKALQAPPFMVAPAPAAGGGSTASMHDQLPPAQSPVRLMVFLSGG